MIQVIEKVVDILEWLAREPANPQPLGDIARRCNLNAGTCANILKTMVARGLVDQPVPRKGYVLGPLVFALADRGPHRGDLATSAAVVDRVARQIGETVLVATLRGERRYILHVAYGNHAIQIRPDIVFLSDTCDTATGRLLMAFLPPSQLERFVAHFRPPADLWPEARTPGLLARELEAIRRARHCRHVNKEDLTQLSWPIEEAGRVVAALGISMPSLRFRGAHRKDVLAAGRAAAEEISRNLAVAPWAPGPQTVSDAGAMNGSKR